MDTDRSVTWMTAVLVVLAITAAVWWYTVNDASPGVPNTGISSTSPLQYTAD